MPTNAPDRSPSSTTPKQQSLLDDAAAATPVPFTLTARARRVIAPDSLPSLTVVAKAPRRDAAALPTDNAVPDSAESPGDHAEQDGPADPRRARARALRRAGTRPEAIAAELAVPIEIVTAWTEAVAPAPRAVQRQQAAARRAEGQLPVAYVTAHAAARAAWQRGEATLMTGMVAGMAEVTPFAVHLRAEPDVMAIVLRWLRAELQLDQRFVRAQVLAAPGQALDVATHEVADALDLPLEQVHGRVFSDAPDATARLVQLRLSDPRIAGTIAGWREQLLADAAGRRRPDGNRPADAMVAVAG